MKRILSGLLAVTFFALPAQTETETESGFANLSRLMQRQLQRDPQKAKEQLIQSLFEINSGGFVTNEILETRIRMLDAANIWQRAYQVFQFDLDDDMTISADEIALQMPILSTQLKTLLSTLTATADEDGDGNLSSGEILDYYRQTATNRRGSRQAELYSGFMVFDSDGDGRVEPREIATTIDHWVATGQLAKTPRRPAVSGPETNARAQCALPKPSAKSEIVLLGGYEGSGLSNIAVSGPDNVTTVSTIHIEAGDTPLYIVASSHAPIIWKLEGAIDRVEKLVAQQNWRRGAAVAGLPKEQLHFFHSACLPGYFHNVDSGRALSAMVRISRQLGRKVTHLIGGYTLGKVALPSGVIAKAMTPEGISGPKRATQPERYIATENGLVRVDETSDASKLAKVEAEMRRFNPDGVIRLVPEDLIAERPVARYEVLPQQAGLLQLMKAGSISLTQKGYYLITKPIKSFPPGLAGAHSVRFLLGKDVPMPGGSPGHSEVFSEETGKCLIGVRCR